MLTRSMSRMPSSPIFRCSLQLVILSSFYSCHASRPGVSILVGLGIFCLLSFLLLHTVVVVVMNYVFVDVLDIEFSHYFPACYQCLLSLIYIMIYIMPTGDYIYKVICSQLLLTTNQVHLRSKVLCTNSLIYFLQQS